MLSRRYWVYAGSRRRPLSVRGRPLGPFIGEVDEQHAVREGRGSATGPSLPCSCAWLGARACCRVLGDRQLRAWYLHRHPRPHWASVIGSREQQGHPRGTWVTKLSLGASLVTHVGNAPGRSRGFDREGQSRTVFRPNRGPRPLPRCSQFVKPERHRTSAPPTDATPLAASTGPSLA
jgi:hypothetical protein